ncbi:MAG TPA: hypothetical protein VE993_19685 [Stellaceae bacterium]|nr:hypothetical protein [Stellaceae bacterium]
MRANTGVRQQRVGAMPLELSEQEMAALIDLLTETREAEPPRLPPRRRNPAAFRDGKRPAANRSLRPHRAIKKRRR